MQLQAALMPEYIKSSLKQGAFKMGKITPRGSAHDADPRGVLASAAVLSTPAAGGKKWHGDTKNAAK
jgi:hypothetical protein